MKSSFGGFTTIRAVGPLILAAVFGFPGTSIAQMDDQIDEIRQLVLEDFDPQLLGAGYAAIVSFAVSPDITTATFYPDSSEGVVDPELNVIRIPYRHVFGEESNGARPFVQGLLAYQTFESGFDLAPDEFIDSRWRTYGAAVSGGFEIPAGDHLVILPAVNFGYGRLDNSAHYSGPISTGLLRPALAGIAFDWDADVVVYGASLGIDYRRQVRKFDIEVLGSITHHRVDSVSTSSPYVDIESKVTAFDIEINSVHPTSMTLGSHPLAFVALLGNTTFLGPQRDALGFSNFFEAGAALDIDVASKGWKVKSLRFGAKAIFGSDIKGWSLIFGYGT